MTPTARDVRIGCCGFPLGLAKYAQIFPVVEVQQTFYQPPLVKTLQKWRTQVPSAFEFTLKAWQLITHEASSPTYRRLRKRLSNKQKREVGAFRLNETVLAAWRRTWECAQALRSRTILFQCPTRFAPTRENKANLRTFFHAISSEAPPEELGEGLTFVWEPRGDWTPAEIKELCAELNLAHGVDPFVQEPVTTEPGYFRLHGRAGYRYQHTDQDLAELLNKARARTPCYVLFNNISMLEDARRFQQLIGKP